MSKGTHALRIVQKGIKHVIRPFTPTTDPFGYLVEAEVNGKAFSAWVKTASSMEEAAWEYLEEKVGVVPPHPLIARIYRIPEPSLETAGDGWHIRVWCWGSQYARNKRRLGCGGSDA